KPAAAVKDTGTVVTPLRGTLTAGPRPPTAMPVGAVAVSITGPGATLPTEESTRLALTVPPGTTDRDWGLMNSEIEGIAGVLNDEGVEAVTPALVALVALSV